MPPTITLHLNFFQWSWLSNKVIETAQQAPVQRFELETLIIQDMYRRRLHSFTFYKKQPMGMKLNLQQFEAYAVQRYFSAAYPEYNTFMRMFIETKLLPSNC